MEYSHPYIFDFKDCDNEQITYVKKYLLTHKIPVNRIINEKDNDAKNIKDIILSSTTFADDKIYSFQTKLYFFLNGYTNFPKCSREGCSNLIEGHNIRTMAEYYKFPKFCSDVCKYGNFETVKHRNDIAKRLDESKLFSDEEMLCQLKQLISEHPYNYVTHIKAKNNWWSFLMDFIMRKTKNLDARYTMHTRIGWILNNYSDFPKCENPLCHNTFEGRNIDRGQFEYPRFCSNKCQMSSSAVKEKAKRTKDVLYGDRTINRKREIARCKCEENRKKTDAEKLEILRKLVMNHPHTYEKMLHSKNKYGRGDDNSYLIDFINEKTPFLNNVNVSLNTKVYCVLNDITEFPHCITCGKEMGNRDIISFRKGFPIFCSSKCANLNKEIQKKSKKTKLERYGDENYSNHAQAAITLKRKSVEEKSEIRNRIEQTNLKTYGVRYAVQSDFVKNKIKNTFINHFGVENPAKCSTVRNKYKKTCLEKYGCENAFQNDEIKRKIAQTNLEKYGFEHAFQNEEVFKRMKKNYVYNGIQFHSSWELAYYIWLVDNNVEFEYQPKEHFKYECNGKVHYYCPDFKVDNQFIEIKGDQFFDKDGKMTNPFCDDHGITEAKQKLMADNNIVILKGADIKKYIDYVNNKYGKTYLKSFKRK